MLTYIEETLLPLAVWMSVLSVLIQAFPSYWDFTAVTNKVLSSLEINPEFSVISTAAELIKYEVIPSSR